MDGWCLVGDMLPKRQHALLALMLPWATATQHCKKETNIFTNYTSEICKLFSVVAKNGVVN